MNWWDFSYIVPGTYALHFYPYRSIVLFGIGIVVVVLIGFKRNVKLFKCRTCEVRLGLRETYGSIISFWKNYCQLCWYKRLLNESKDDVRFWKRAIKEAMK